MKTPAQSDLVEMLFKLSRLMKGEMSFSNHLIHLSILQIQALIFLYQHKDQRVTMSDLAGHFRIELPSASSLLAKLYDQGLVARHADAGDRRLVLITLTPQGDDLVVQAITERRRKLQHLLSYLSPTEQAQLRSIINNLSTNLQK